jgi:hypothetical protein
MLTAEAGKKMTIANLMQQQAIQWTIWFVMDLLKFLL